MSDATAPTPAAPRHERAPVRWDYAPAPESRDAATLRDEYGLFIGGAFVAPTDGTRLATTNPATEEALAEVAFAGPGDVDRAVAAARRAAPGWRALPGLERGKHLFRVARLIQERARELAVVETLDGGKPIRESRDVDVPLAAAHFFHYAGWADKLAYALPGRRVRPRGVVGQVVPWNFPLLMAAWKLAPALACGNTVVLKPAETTPLTALLLAEICRDAEIPDGVVNVVPGEGATGAALVRASVDKVAFTGSTAVGRDIQRALAGTGVGLTLELGGKSANIVFEDAALDQAVEGIVEGIFFNQGHVCCAGSRVLVQESVASEVVRKLWDRMQLLRVGDPLDKNTDVGAINSAAQLHRIEALVAEGEREGARRRTIACELPARGHWFAPTMFLDAAPAHRIAVEEIFGPVVSVTTFRTPAEAVAREQLGLRPGGGGLDGQGRQGVPGHRAAQGRRGLAEHVQPVRPHRGVRRLQGERLRARGWQGGPAPVRRGRPVSGRLSVPRRTSSTSAAASRARSPAARTRPPITGAAPWRTCPARRARTSATR